MSKKIDWESKKNEWVKLVNELCDEMKIWAESQGWFVDKHEKTITEEHLGTYIVHELFIKNSEGRLTIEPIGRNIIGAEGRVDICSFPTFNRMLLIRSENKWHLKTDSLVAWPVSWSKKAFIEIAESLNATV